MGAGDIRRPRRATTHASRPAPTDDQTTVVRRFRLNRNTYQISVPKAKPTEKIFRIPAMNSQPGTPPSVPSSPMTATGTDRTSAPTRPKQRQPGRFSASLGERRQRSEPRHTQPRGATALPATEGEKRWQLNIHYVKPEVGAERRAAVIASNSQRPIPVASYQCNAAQTISPLAACRT